MGLPSGMSDLFGGAFGGVPQEYGAAQQRQQPFPSVEPQRNELIGALWMHRQTQNAYVPPPPTEQELALAEVAALRADAGKTDWLWLGWLAVMAGGFILKAVL